MSLYDEAMHFFSRMNDFTSAAALRTMEKYINGALIQRDRIERDKNALPSRGPGVDHESMQMLFLDIHFYFICLDKVQNLLKLIAKNDGDPSIRKLWNRLAPVIKPYNDARNHLEHIETRLASDRYLLDLGNLTGDYYTFGGEFFNISREGLAIFTQAYEELLSGMGEESPMLCMGDEFTHHQSYELSS